MLQPRPVEILDIDIDDEYTADIAELYENYQSESPDYFLINQEQ